MSKRGHGETCTYCKRALESVSSPSRVAATRDHIFPKSRGGRSTVWCCRQCNSIKGDMSYEEWVTFMMLTPEWWKRPEFAQHGRRGTPRYKRVPRTIVPVNVERIQTAMTALPAVPVEYTDPKAQAAFEGVYRKRKHMLRTPPPEPPKMALRGGYWLEK